MHGLQDYTPSRDDMEEMLRMRKRELASTAGDIQRLMVEEATLVADVAAEQARWSEINRRLEEIERGLTRPQ